MAPGIGKRAVNTMDPPRDGDCLSCLYMNARSLKTISRNCNKLVEFQNLVCSHDAQIVAVTETWLNETVVDAELLPPNYFIYRKDRHDTVANKRGGGVLLAIDQQIASKRRADLETQCEIIVCEIKTIHHPKVAIVLCYRPPDTDRILFNNHLENVLFNVFKEFTFVCLLGDFNLPEIDWLNPGHASHTNADFINLIVCYGLNQINAIPSNDHNHLLDLLFTNSNHLVRDVHKVDCSFQSDHAVLSFDLCVRTKQATGFKRTVYNYQRADFNRLFSMLNDSVLLNAISNSLDINEMWSKWLSALTNAVDSCVPKITIRCRREPPWFDPESRHLVKRKRTAWRKAKRRNTPEAWANYRAIRNHASAQLRAKHDAFINSLAPIIKQNPKRFWSFFQFRTKARSLPNEIYLDGTTCSDSLDKAILFNSYFSSVFSKTSVSTFPNITPCIDEPISEPVISANHVCDILSDLDVNSACGPCGISPLILKRCAPLLAPSLAVMFNMSLESGRLPQEWKKANITPVFKKGDKQCVSNYRPISLLCTASKVMERCLFNHLYPSVETKIHPLQHGFMKGRSCNSQLLKVYHSIASALDRGGQVDIVYLDFTKAFDCISHELLLYKLEHFYKISGNLLLWVKDYLSNRSQRVTLESESSTWLPVLSGVPQGSILGPLMFLLYIDDLPSAVSCCTTALFADDSKCFKEISSPTDCILIQRDIDQLYEWSRTVAYVKFYLSLETPTLIILITQ